MISLLLFSLLPCISLASPTRLAAPDFEGAVSSQTSASATATTTTTMLPASAQTSLPAWTHGVIDSQPNTFLVGQAFYHGAPEGPMHLYDPASTVPYADCSLPAVNTSSLTLPLQIPTSFGLPLNVYQPCSLPTYSYAVTHQTSLTVYGLSIRHV